MPLIRIAEFGKAGVNTDVEPTLLQPGEWTTLDNIDIESGDIRSAYGDTSIGNVGEGGEMSGLPVVPRYTYVFESANDTWLVISDGTKVYVSNGNSYQDITPSEGATTTYQWDDGQLEALIGASTWDAPEASNLRWDDLTDAGGAPVIFDGEVTFTVFLGTLIVTPTGGVPTYWPDDTGRLQPLPGWPETWRAQTIVAYKNFLVAVGLNDGTTEGPKYTVAWSDAAAAGEMPLSWDPVSPVGSLAGLVQLRDTDGYLVTAALQRDDLALFKNDSIYRMYFNPGSEAIMSFEKVISDHGCDSPLGVAAVGDSLFFADRGDLRVFDGQQTQSVAALKIKEALQSAISNDFRDATVVLAYPEREQVWVGVVPAGSDTLDVVVIYDLIHNAWCMKRYPGAISMTLGPYSVTIQDEGGSWDSAGSVTWDGKEGSWDDSIFEPTEDGVIFGSVNSLWRADKSNTDYRGNPKTCLAEKTGLMLADMDQNVTLKAVYLEAEGDATMQVSVGTQWVNGAPINWTAPQDFTPGVTKKINVRATGQPCGLRVKSYTDGGWRLGAVSFQLTGAGRR